MQTQPEPANSRYDATVVIVTKNRQAELRNAVESAVQQEGKVEVLVIDDGSTDGTAEMIRSEFPSVHLERVEQSLGYIAHRNRAAELAQSPVVVSIDDDATFSTPYTVQQTLAEFNHPRVGAVAIPSIDVNRPGSPLYCDPPPDQNSIWAVETYRGTAHAVRRDLFLKLGGYRVSFFHQGEEGEFCLRLLNSGFITRLGSASPIHHFESPKRDHTRKAVYSTRNAMLFAWYDVPMPYLLVHLPATMFNSIMYGMKRNYPVAVLRGMLLGIGRILSELGQRRPVRPTVYRLSRRLRKRGAAKLEEIESKLPEIEC